MPSFQTSEPLQRAIELAGGLTALARALGIRAPSISEWKRRGRIPANRVLAIEAATGVPRHELRPDLYPEPNCGGHA
jgi:DNA-binding transcriptional regulator YdaS (Cro superfamily)